MSDNENHQQNNNQQGPAPKSPDAVRAKIDQQIKQAKLKSFEAGLKVLVDKEDAAKKVLKGIQAEITAYNDDHEELFSK